MSRDLVIAWALLVALSLATTALSLFGMGLLPTQVMGLVILALAILKARTVLRGYLGLADAPSWRAGADLVLALMGLLYAGLFLAGSS